MSRPQKCSKLLEGREHETIDKISSLPDELLVDILSILPTRCAVGTSVLSSRWKYLHMFTNCLSFDVPYVMGQEAANAQKKSYRTFVNKVLLSHEVSPIKKFHLDCDRHNYGSSQLHTWIGVALSKRVEQLHLFLGRRPPHNALPNCLFNCQTIVELKIDSIIEDLHVPKEIYLPNLKILYFKQVCFVDYDSLGRFFSGCPLLQDLVVEYCKFSNKTDRHVRVSLEELKRLTICISEGWFEIDSPKLVYLNICCSGEGYIVLSLKNPEYLVTAHVEFRFVSDSDELQRALALIKAVHHVKELYLELETVKRFSGSEDHHLPSYPNLVKLSIGRWSNNDLKYLRHLLVNSPRLETVVFDRGLQMETFRCKRGDKWPANVELAPFSSNVKVIEAQFLGYTRELVFLKYLLGNANELNTLILKCYMTEKQTLEARKKLFKFPRASGTCDIQMRGRFCAENL